MFKGAKCFMSNGDKYFYIPSKNMFFCVKDVVIRTVYIDDVRRSVKYILKGYGFRCDAHKFTVDDNDIIINNNDRMVEICEDTFYMEMNSRYKQFLINIM